MNIMVDTQIWIFSKKIPKKDKYNSEFDFQKALKLHKKAKKFFQNLPEKTIIYISTHQLGELYHSLSFGGAKIPFEQSKNFILELCRSKNVEIIPYTEQDIKTALKLSTESKIHIWDYLCVLPLLEHLKLIYSNDIHLKDKTFSNLGLKIENPVEIWQKI